MMTRMPMAVFLALMLGCHESPTTPGPESEPAPPNPDVRARGQRASRVDQSNRDASDRGELESPQRLDVAQSDTFQVSIATSKQDHLEYEPVVVKVTVKNTTQLVASYGIREMERGLTVSIRDPHGRRLVPKNMGLGHDEGGGPLHPLNPNGVVEVYSRLDRLVDAESQEHYKWDVFFDIPGPYEITVTYRRCRSNALTIQVKEPIGAERKASELFRAIRDFPWLSDDESLLRCRQLIDGYATTTYGQYARLAMGWHLFGEAHNADEEESAQLLADGVQMLEALLKDSPSFPLAASVKYTIAAAHCREGTGALRRLSRNVEWLGPVNVVVLWGGTIPSAGNNSQTDDTVQLSISVHKQQFLPREPVVLTVRVSNPTDAKKAVVLLDRPGVTRVRFAFRYPDDAQIRGSAAASGTGEPDLATAKTYQTTVLCPQAQVVYRELFLNANRGPGTYTIQAHLTPIPGVQNDRLESNTLTIEVTEPQDEEKTALALFEKENNDGDIRVEWYKSFIEEYPDSTYTPYARLILGRFHLSIGQYDDAIQTLRELLETTPDFPLALEVRHDIAQANYRKGIKAFQDLIARNPTWVGSRRAEAVLLHGGDP